MFLLKTLVVAFLVAVNCEDVAHTAKTHCGIRNENGINLKPHNVRNESEFGEFPWMVALVNTKRNQFLCGGSVITPKVILTLPHCVTGPHIDQLENIAVRVGEWDSDSDHERLPYQESKIAKIIAHPDYREDDHMSNNIVLIILEKELVRDDHVGTICMPLNGLEFTSKKDCYSMGWGISKHEHVPNHILKKIKTPLVGVAECEDAIRSKIGGNFKLHRSTICAGPGEEADTCLGDSGGPLVCPDPNNSNRYLLAGIVSWGTRHCGFDPTVFTKVSYFRDWVDQEMKKEKLDNDPYLI